MTTPRLRGSLPFNPSPCTGELSTHTLKGLGAFLLSPLAMAWPGSSPAEPGERCPTWRSS